MIDCFEECLDVQSALDFTLAQGLCLSGAELGNVQLMDWRGGSLNRIAKRFRRGVPDLLQQGYHQRWFGVCSRASKTGADHRRGRDVGYRIRCLPDDRLQRRFSRGSIDPHRFEQRGIDRRALDAFSVAAQAERCDHGGVEGSGANADVIILRRSAMYDVGSMIERSGQALEDSYRVLTRADHAVRYFRGRDQKADWRSQPLPAGS